MNISETGLKLIQSFESCSLEAYPDPGTGGDPWTIGWGHTGGVQEGDTCTQEQADNWLREDCKHAETCINQSVSADLTQNEFDALVSLVFNIGGTNFRHSTLLKDLNDGAFDLAEAEFKRWDHAGGKILAGLTARRKAEAELFGSA